MTKEQVLLVVQETIKKNTDKSSMGLAYEQGFEDGANYALQKLEQCNVMRSLQDEVMNISKIAVKKYVDNAHRPLSEATIEAKAVIQVCEHMLGFILSNDV